jgi:NADP-dependent 3-hydroxy acid dehydrogenase YdfG
MNPNKIVLITGATAGIGEATAKLLAKNHYDLILTGRRIDRLDTLSSELKKDNDIRILTLNFDVQDREMTEEILGNLPDEWKNIEVLINNAGLASGLDHIHEGNTDDWDKMIDTNIKGLLYVTRVISPGMVERKNGHIINISSIAGKEAYEKGNVYCGTKHAVEAITKGMRIDLLKHNIRVTSVEPGAVETEFSNVRFHGDDERAKKVYEGFTPLFGEDIAEAILFAITRPKHVTINELLIMPTAQANASTINRNTD